MNANMGGIDRILRIAIGAGLIVAVQLDLIGSLGWEWRSTWGADLP
jgi:hypothetical protein